MGGSGVRRDWIKDPHMLVSEVSGDEESWRRPGRKKEVELLCWNNAQ